MTQTQPGPDLPDVARRYLLAVGSGAVPGLVVVRHPSNVQPYAQWHTTTQQYSETLPGLNRLNWTTRRPTAAAYATRFRLRSKTSEVRTTRPVIVWPDAPEDLMGVMIGATSGGLGNWYDEGEPALTKLCRDLLATESLATHSAAICQINDRAEAAAREKEAAAHHDPRPRPLPLLPHDLFPELARKLHRDLGLLAETGTFWRSTTPSKAWGCKVDARNPYKVTEIEVTGHMDFAADRDAYLVMGDFRNGRMTAASVRSP